VIRTVHALLADHGLDGPVDARMRDGRAHATIRLTEPGRATIDALAADLDRYSFGYEIVDGCTP
jgi:hypothetical protein